MAIGSKTKTIVASLTIMAFAMGSPNGKARAAEAPAIGTNRGEVHPDFMLPDLDGGYGRLSDYRGKKILLFHFASW